MSKQSPIKIWSKGRYLQSAGFLFYVMGIIFEVKALQNVVWIDFCSLV
jgi:hypothetical protein